MDNISTLTVEESVRMTEDRDKRRKYVHGPRLKKRRTAYALLLSAGVSGCICRTQRYGTFSLTYLGGSVAEWLACWTQAQKGLRSNRNRDAVG